MHDIATFQDSKPVSAFSHLRFMRTKRFKGWRLSQPCIYTLYPQAMKGAIKVSVRK